MSNKNGTRTIQADSELVKELSLLAITKNTTRKALINLAIQEFLSNNK